MQLSFVIFAIPLTLVPPIFFYFFRRIRSKKLVKLVWTTISDIERCYNLSYEEFVSEYESIGKPVIITDAMQNWHALNKWTLDFFKTSKYGQLIKRTVKDDRDQQHQLMTIADYLDYITTVNTEKPLYFANCFLSYFPELLEDYQEPIYFKNWLNKLPHNLLRKYGLDNPELFIGSKNTSVGLHKDPGSFSAWIGLIYGRKKVLMFAPDQEQFLYDGQVDIYNPDLNKFPLYTQAQPIEFVLEAGEILYIPPNWWHHVRNLEHTIALGNLFVNEWNSELVFQDFVTESSILGHLVPLILEYPWLGKTLFALGII
jgi:Cupin-like domain